MDHTAKSTLRKSHKVRVNTPALKRDPVDQDINGVSHKEPVAYAQKTVVAVRESMVDRLLRETRNKLL